MKKYIEFLLKIPTDEEIKNGTTTEFRCFEGEKRNIIDESKDAYYFIKGNYKFGMPKIYEGRMYVVKNIINDNTDRRDVVG